MNDNYYDPATGKTAPVQPTAHGAVSAQPCPSCGRCPTCGQTPNLVITPPRNPWWYTPQVVPTWPRYPTSYTYTFLGNTNPGSASVTANVSVPGDDLRLSDVRAASEHNHHA